MWRRAQKAKPSLQLLLKLVISMFCGGKAALITKLQSQSMNEIVLRWGAISEFAVGKVRNYSSLRTFNSDASYFPDPFIQQHEKKVSAQATREFLSASGILQALKHLILKLTHPSSSVHPSISWPYLVKEDSRSSRTTPFNNSWTTHDKTRRSDSPRGLVPRPATAVHSSPHSLKGF